MLDENLNLVTKIDDSDGVRKVNIGGMWIPFDDDPSSIPDALVQPGGAQDFDSFSDDGKLHILVSTISFISTKQHCDA